jgi:hypothetical protein
MTPCMTRILSMSLLSAALASAGTYAGVTATEPTAATASYVCPQGISSSDCSYLTDLNNAGLPVPANAINAAGIICIDLRGETTGQLAQAYVLGHPGWTTDMADQLISITQKDMCQ